MIDDTQPYEAVIAAIDAANASDPRLEIDGSRTRPREVVYAERMSECLGRIYPEASEDLRIAARAQHICRWQIPRIGYPLGREGYNAWRSACREHHAALVAPIMRRHGYAEPRIAHVVALIKKQDIKRNRESQALENVAAVVFVERYLADFIATHDHYTEEKLVMILKKTLRKMDAFGHAAILDLRLPDHVQRIVDIARA